MSENNYKKQFKISKTLDFENAGKELTIGEKIYKIRKTRNLTQEEFAEELGISVQTVKKYERIDIDNNTDNTENKKQTKTSPILIIKKIAEKSDYSADYIIGVNKNKEDISKKLGLVEDYTGIDTNILKLLNKNLLQYSKSTKNSKNTDIEIYKTILNSLLLIFFPNIIILIKKYLNITIIHKIINNEKIDTNRESLSESILGISEFFKWKTIEELNEHFNKTVEYIIDIIPKDLKQINETNLKKNDEYIFGKELIEQIMNKLELFNADIEQELLIKEVNKNLNLITENLNLNKKEENNDEEEINNN